MRDVENLLECLRIASEDVEVLDPWLAVDRALTGLRDHRKGVLRPDLVRLMRAYGVSSMEDLRKVYEAQKRAYDSQNAPAEYGSAKTKEG